ncbi:MAG: NAD(P)H-dependent oxidoreductase [SAR324 cluster bacterium]|nr:NAD(P)H-dependent oxidoreductase [SAR324 cluster bacterium]
MKKLLLIIAKALPFMGFSLVITMSMVGRNNPNFTWPYLIAALGMILVGQGVHRVFKTRDLFGLGLTSVILLALGLHFFSPFGARWFLSHATSGIYLGLFFAALVPPMLGVPPFTVEAAQKNFPPAVQKTDAFKVVTIQMSWIWAGLFFAALILSYLPYSVDSGLNLIFQNLLAPMPLLLIGVPLTIKLPNYLVQQNTKSKGAYHFENLKDAFEAMPFGINKEKTGGIDSILQFYFTGLEIFSGYLKIKDGGCSFTYGEHPSPECKVTCDSELWLKITNGELDGAEAYLKNLYQTTGDISTLTQLQSLFSNEETGPVIAETPQDLGHFEYGQLRPKTIKKVLMIDGGPRNSKFSKSSLLARAFAQGVEEAGGEVEWLALRKLKIQNCTGCYECWTKSPGKCRINRVAAKTSAVPLDPMEELRAKFREADLIGWITPLYTFSVHPLLKAFMDRLLPELQPYMIEKNNLTGHPHRRPHPKAMVTFSAAGFPDLKGNFEGLAWTFRNMSLHEEAGVMLGEFYLSAAELLAQPAYATRKRKVEKACYEAGKEAVSQGKISQHWMADVSNVGVSRETFSSQANLFWEQLDGKKAYYKGQPALTELTIKAG